MARWHARLLHGALAWGLASVLSACGGGGGSPSTPATTPGGQPTVGPTQVTTQAFTASATSLSAQYVLGSNPYEVLTEKVTLTANRPDLAGYAIGYPVGVGVPSWLSVGSQLYGGQVELPLTFTPGSLQLGTYQTTLRVVGGTVNYDILGTVDLPVSLSVVHPDTLPTASATSVLQLSSSSLEMATSAGDNIRPYMELQITAPPASGQKLVVTPTPGSSQLPGQQLTVVRAGPNAWTASVAASYFPAMGRHEGSMRLTLIDIDGRVRARQDVPLTLRVLRPVYASLSTVPKALRVLGTEASWGGRLTVIADDQPWQLTQGSSGDANVRAVLSASSGKGSAVLDVTLDDTQSRPGLQRFDWTVRGEDGLQNTVNHTVQVAAPTLSVEPAYGVVRQTVTGVPVAPVVFKLAIDNGTDPVVEASSDVPWLEITQASDRLTSERQLVFKPEASNLGAGTHNGRVTVRTTSGGVVLNRTVDVTLQQVAPAFTADTAKIVLGGDLGRDASSRLVKLKMDAQVTGVTWQLVSAPAWLKVKRTSGTFINGESVQVLNHDLSTLEPGGYKGEVQWQAKVLGDTLLLKVPVEALVDRRRLVPEAVGVSLWSSPNRQVLSRQLRIDDNYGQPLAWTARSTQPWLKVTPSGTAGESLVLEADPTGLTPNRVHEADVVLAASATRLAPIETIRVAFWVGADMPSALAGDMGRWYEPSMSVAMADPIRPYVYFGNSDGRLARFNLVTQEITESPEYLNRTMARAAVSSDGSTLFVLSDHAGVSGGFTVSAHDVATLKNAPDRVSFNLSLRSPSLAVRRHNGRDLLAIGTLLFDASTGKPVGAPALNVQPQTVPGTTQFFYRELSPTLRQGTYDITEATSSSQVVLTGQSGRTPTVGTYAHLRVSPSGDTLASFDFSTGVLGFWRLTDLVTPVFLAPASYKAMPFMAYLPDGRLLAVTVSNIDSTQHTLVLFDENFDSQALDFSSVDDYLTGNYPAEGGWSLAAGGQCVLQVTSEQFVCWPVPSRAPTR